MSYTFAYLYDDTGRPVGHVGVLARMLGTGGYGSYPRVFDAAVFSPWPEALADGSSFAIRTESATGTSPTRWPKPDEVIHFRGVGQPAGNNVSFVVLKGPSRAELAKGVHGIERSLGIDKHGVRDELAKYSPTFQPLTTPEDAVRHLRSTGRQREPVASARLKVVTPAYTSTTGSSKVLARSICRILHWD